jgi:hypothetical protein
VGAGSPDDLGDGGIGNCGHASPGSDAVVAAASPGALWPPGRGDRLHPRLSRFFGARPDRRSAAAGAPPRVDATCPGARYGLGLAAFRTLCGTAVGHTGNLLGTASASWSTRDGSRRVVAMTNSYPLSPAADTAFRRLLDAAFCG